MNTILLAARRHRPSKGRILALEPDADRARELEHLLREHVCAEFAIVKSSRDAVRSINEQIPDLVLTSTFLPPSEEAALAECLKRLPGAAHLQMITIPHFIDSEEAGHEPSKVLSFFTRRSALARPACNPSLVGDQIEEYLDQARVERLMQVNRVLCYEAAGSFVATGQGQSRPDAELIRRRQQEHVNTLSTGANAHTFRLGRAHANDRRRARRHPCGEVPWLWTVKLPFGGDVKVVDISSQGVLLETTSKITPGRTVDLQVLGHNTDLTLPARLTRSEVAAVDAMGVRYRVAAVFSRDLDLLGESKPAAAIPSPSALADLLARVMAEGSTLASPRASFELGLRQLLPVRDIQLRQTPMVPSHGSESIYFTVPCASGPSSILQAIFEPGYQPSPTEFRLLKAAASLAAVVIELAPDASGPQTRRRA